MSECSHNATKRQTIYRGLLGCVEQCVCGAAFSDQDHTPRREGDEWFCIKCKKRWAADEEPPICVEEKGN